MRRNDGLVNVNFINISAKFDTSQQETSASEASLLSAGCFLYSAPAACHSVMTPQETDMRMTGDALLFSRTKQH
jgi:hypothetical protein